jgi:hypothetical protein
MRCACGKSSCPSCAEDARQRAARLGALQELLALARHTGHEPESPAGRACVRAIAGLIRRPQ